MATHRSLFKRLNLVRSALIIPSDKANSLRLFSQFASTVDIVHETVDDITSRILRLRSSDGNTASILQNWVDQGHKIKSCELRDISKRLIKSKRYNHALELLAWMDAEKSLWTSPADCATRLELIIKVHGITKAEEFFSDLPNSILQKAACLPLLHFYVKKKDTEKAEALMLKLSDLGLAVSPHLFNEMMKLYMATSQFNKVPLVILEMKKTNIPLNVLSYNIWMSSCSESSGVAAAEMVYKEMLRDTNVLVGWTTLATLANTYMKAGLVQNALITLRTAEKKLSTCSRVGFLFLITLYASLNNREGVLRLWEASKAVRGRITSANYMCILWCLVKLGDLEEVERIFMEWESECLKYDIRVSNVLLGAYMRNGLMDKVESLHLHTLEKGGCPNYKTWEILMEGWVKVQNMDKAIDALKNGFPLIKHGKWKPSDSNIVAVAEYFEKQGKVEDAYKYLKFLHQSGIANLPVYKSLLRLYRCAQRPAFDILEKMERDKIELDDETSALIQTLRSECTDHDQSSTLPCDQSTPVPPYALKSKFKPINP
ncbi:Pentatricopeptide repeat [Dillenia turbinata]|uniref:Pentatricopeptide repeat n=1 Tax=Dillenia turbinata TaxID=194707 RepID=A0AAN8W2J4_9MAGN